MFSFKIQKYVLFCLCDIEGSEAFYSMFCLLRDELLKMGFHRKAAHRYTQYIQCAPFGKLVNATVPVHIEELFNKWDFFVILL